MDPFTTESTELINLSSGGVASPKCEGDLMSAVSTGDKAFQNFLQDRLLSDKIGFHDRLPMQKLSTFSSQVKGTGKKNDSSASIVAYQGLFAKMLVMSRTREVDLKYVLCHSLGPVSYPLASVDGTSIMKHNTSALLSHVVNQYSCQIDGAPDGSTLIVDGMSLINRIPASALPATWENLEPAFCRKSSGVPSSVIIQGYMLF